MADENDNKIEQRPDKLTVEILSPTSQALSSFMMHGGGLGRQFIPADPSWTYDQLHWNNSFAMYVYRDMEEKDDELTACLDTRKEAVLSKSRVVIPGGEKRQDKKIAEFIDETLEGYMGGTDGTRFGFTNFLWEAMDAIAKGVAIGENIYDVANDRVYIREVKFKPQWMFHFSEGPMEQYQNYGLPQTGDLRLNPNIAFAIDGVDVEQSLPQNKFFVHTFRPYQGNRWGSPLDRKVFWLNWIKREGLKQWLRYLERGAGTIIARYQGAGTQGERELALKAAQAVAEEAAAAISKNFEVESLENVRQSLGSSHKELTDEYCNMAIARVILGQTQTRGGEGGWSKGNVQERVASRKTEVDALSLMLAVNTQLVWPLVLLNFGPVERPPIWTIKYEPPADVKANIDAMYRARLMGADLTKKFFYESNQWPMPGEGEDLMPPLPQTNIPKGDMPEGDTPAAQFAEDDSAVSKKKARRSSGDTPLNSSHSKTQRFKSLRPRTID